MAITPNKADVLHTEFSTTTVICKAQARFIGCEIRDPTNLAMEDDEIPKDRVFTSASPLEGFSIQTLRPQQQRRTSSGSDTSGSDTSSELTALKAHNTSSVDKISPDHKAQDAGCLWPTTLTGTTPQITSLFASRPITLRVGLKQSPGESPCSSTLTAHERLLTGISPFFRAALQSPVIGYSFQEAQSGIINLPDERPDDIAFLLQWAYWQALYDLKTSSHSSATFPPDRILGSLYHHSIDPPVHRYKKWQDEKKLLKQTFGPSSSEVRAFKKLRKRPNPPAFGPLVRLYIIADKFNVQKGLRLQICQRVREVAKQANCVPDADDVAVLYENVVEGPYGGLKKEILELYTDLDVKSVMSLFQGRQTDECDTDDEVYRWHPVFMRDLLLYIVRRSGSSTAGEGMQKHSKESKPVIRRILA